MLLAILTIITDSLLTVFDLKSRFFEFATRLQGNDEPATNKSSK